MNKVILMGRLTRDIELKKTASNNVSVSAFCIAVDKPTKSGEERKADFINIVAWGKLAEFVEKYFHKGDMIAVCGKIQTRNYEDKDGKTVYVTEVLADEAHFCGSKKSDNVTNDDLPF